MQQAASTAMQQYKLQVVDSREISVNGLPTLAVVADQPAQQQGAPSLRTLSYFIQHRGNIYHLIGVSAGGDFNAYAPYFENSMGSFRELTDATKINKLPERVRIKTVQQSGTLEQALRSYNVPERRLQELALLNGRLLTDRVEANSLIKILGP